jgi:hypothetical protein
VTVIVQVALIFQPLLQPLACVQHPVPHTQKCFACSMWTPERCSCKHLQIEQPYVRRS